MSVVRGRVLNRKRKSDKQHQSSCSGPALVSDAGASGVGYKMLDWSVDANRSDASMKHFNWLQLHALHTPDDMAGADVL
ncbi:uncharacterized [Tachysurus ichikawai]